MESRVTNFRPMLAALFCVLSIAAISAYADTDKVAKPIDRIIAVVNDDVTS